MLEKPSTGVQADAIAAQVLSAAGGATATLALASAGVEPDIYVPFAGLALAATGLATWEALRKLRYERRYGRFLMVSPVVASADLRDDDGRLLARRGEDEILELHLIGDLAEMARLVRSGLPGRMAVILEGLRGLRGLIADMGDPLYARVTLVTARPHLLNMLDRLGFSEIEHPPRRSAADAVLHRIASARVALSTGGTPLGLDESRMSWMPRERFSSEEFATVVEAQTARVERDLERLEARNHATA